MKIAEGVAMFDISSSLALGPDTIHPSLLWDDNAAILVDAGLPGQLPQFKAVMAECGVAFSRLDKVIITHHDMDHFGGLAAIVREASQKITILAHPNEKPYLETELPPVRLSQMEAQLDSLTGERGQQLKTLYETLKANYPKLKVHVDQTVEDGAELPDCGGITVIATPGHTPGHICLYLKQSKTLIAGDALNVTDGKLAPAPKFTILDQAAAVHSLQKLTRYDIEKVICYHGGLFTDNPKQRIAELAAAE